MTPALLGLVAHGIAGRADLPIPVWLFADAAGLALLVSFLLLGFYWRTPRLARAASGRTAPDLNQRILAVGAVIARVVVFALYVLLTIAAFWGSDSQATNPAPRWFYVVFWVGMQLASALIGDVWRAISPLDTIAIAARQVRGIRPSAAPEPDDDSGSLAWSHWPALIGLGGFLWLELCYHSPDSPRVVGVFIVGYSTLMLLGAARWGRVWLRTGEGFGVLFSLLAAMSTHVRIDGKWHVRWPFTGLATIRLRRGTAAVILVVLGGTAFDGLSRTGWWQNDVIDTSQGWRATALNTIGLVWVIGLVALAWIVASRVAARLSGRDPRDPAEISRYIASLIPIALAYAVAHYFSYFIYESQTAIAQLSDPFGNGSNLFHTITWTPTYTSLTLNQIAYVQTAAIVIGHVAGVVVAHDIAVTDLKPKVATKSQYPFLAVMVTYTVVGLFLLLKA